LRNPLETGYSKPDNFPDSSFKSGSRFVRRRKGLKP